ncbi:MAG: hypothetical protein ABJB86_16820 [Bacteroidota bacterium]
MNEQEALLESAYASRGRIIQLATEMEAMIDLIISKYFTEDTIKQEELIMTVLSPCVGLGKKSGLLEFVLSKKTENSKPDIDMLIGQIEKIVAQRNIFAHWPLDFSKAALQLFKDKKTISFQRLKTSKDKGQIVLGCANLYEDINVNAWIGLIKEVNNSLWLYLKQNSAYPFQETTQ